MENKNILLIVISVCAFLVIIFAIGFVWSMPDKGKNESGKPLDEEIGSNIDIFEHVRDEKEPLGLEPTQEPSDKVTIIYGEQKDSGDSTSGKDTKDGTLKDEEDITDKGKETIIVKVPDDKKYDYPTTWIVKEQPVVVRKKTSPTPKPKIATTVVKKKQTIGYDIQSGSFKIRSNAEALNQKLIEHGFEGKIDVKEVNNVIYYRVRVGTFTNRAEAEKFLSWMKVLDGMEGCYISQVPLKK